MRCDVKSLVVVPVEARGRVRRRQGTRRLRRASVQQLDRMAPLNHQILLAHAFLAGFVATRACDYDAAARLFRKPVTIPEDNIYLNREIVLSREERLQRSDDIRSVPDRASIKLPESLEKLGE